METRRRDERDNYFLSLSAEYGNLVKKKILSPGTPSSKAKKKFFFFPPKTGCSNWITFVQTGSLFVMGYGCARRSVRERIRMVLFYGE